MKRFVSSFGLIELTDERMGHILAFHPEIRLAVRYFDSTLEKPDFLKPSQRDSTVVIFYRAVSGTKKLAIVVKLKTKPFILTAYFVTNVKQNHENKN